MQIYDYIKEGMLIPKPFYYRIGTTNKKKN